VWALALAASVTGVDLCALVITFPSPDSSLDEPIEFSPSEITESERDGIENQIVELNWREDSQRIVSDI